MDKLLTAIKQAMSENQLLQEAFTDAPDFKRAVDTRRLVMRAIGTLMEKHNFSEADALRQLQQISRDKSLTMKEAAQEIIGMSEISVGAPPPQCE